MCNLLSVMAVPEMCYCEMIFKGNFKIDYSKGYGKYNIPHPPSYNSTVAGVHMETGPHAPVSFSIQKYNVLGKPRLSKTG